MVTTSASAMAVRVKAWLPRGDSLPDRVWLARHRGICVLLWGHVVVLFAIGLLRGRSVELSLIGPAIVAVLTLAAMRSSFSHTVRSSLATLGLLSCSAILIDLFGGLIEAHFHFFVTIAVVSLYQSWRPYLLAVGYVLVHHLVLGTILPTLVYNHHMAMEHPWIFAMVHAGAVLAESVACLVFWRLTEEALDAERANGEALKESITELSRAHLAVADLVAMLSHDLRIPVSVLIGYSEMALESWAEMSETEKLDFVRKVGSAGDSLHTMLEEALAVSVLDAGGVEPRSTAVRVDSAVREMLGTLPPPLPDVDLAMLETATAYVDRGHLDQVLANLLTNAVKYGGGAFSVSCHEDIDSVVLSIADSGTGVSPAFVPELFDRFTRSEEARSGTQKGTGLGLYITEKLLVINAGSIRYLPTEGGGATFCLHLPRAARAVRPTGGPDLPAVATTQA